VSRMSEYCKAYPVKRFRAFAGWSEDTNALRPRHDDATAATDTTTRELADDEVLFLHDNYHVTDGIFPDEHIVFAQDSPEWRAFCHEVLAFEVPDYLRAPIESSADATAHAAS
jgi:hypothetical protein